MENTNNWFNDEDEFEKLLNKYINDMDDDSDDDDNDDDEIDEEDETEEEDTSFADDEDFQVGRLSRTRASASKLKSCALSPIQGRNWISW